MAFAIPFRIGALLAPLLNPREELKAVPKFGARSSSILADRIARHVYHDERLLPYRRSGPRRAWGKPVVLWSASATPQAISEVHFAKSNPEGFNFLDFGNHTDS